MLFVIFSVNQEIIKRQRQKRFQKSFTNIGKNFFRQISAIHIYDSRHGYELSWFIPKICAGFTLTILFYAR